MEEPPYGPRSRAGFSLKAAARLARARAGGRGVGRVGWKHISITTRGKPLQKAPAYELPPSRTSPNGVEDCSVLRALCAAFRPSSPAPWWPNALVLYTNTQRPRVKARYPKNIAGGEPSARALSLVDALALGRLARRTRSAKATRRRKTQTRHAVLCAAVHGTRSTSLLPGTIYSYKVLGGCSARALVSVRSSTCTSYLHVEMDE